MREVDGGRKRKVLIGLAAGGLGLAVLAGLFFIGPMSGAMRYLWSDRSFQGNALHGGQLAKAQCKACHGPTGNSRNPQIPKLAGQDSNYLYAQLLAFRSGSRHSEVMSPIATSVPEANARDLATYFSAEARTPDPNPDEQLAARGRSIYFSGRDGGMMSRCAACHSADGGMMGRGMMAMMRAANAPNLNGQHAAYLTAQLDRFASGQRQSSVMDRIAASLSEADRKAVAAYLSGLH